MKKNRRISLFLAMFFAVSILAGSVFAASEDELNAKKSQAQDAKEAAQYQVDLTQNTIDGINNELKKSNAALDKINNLITALDGQIATANKELDNRKKKLDQAVKAQKKQENDFKNRLRADYMYGNEEDYIQILFSSKSIGDFIARTEIIISVINADQKALSDLEKARAEVENQKHMAEEKITDLNKKKEEQNQLKAQQETIKAQQQQLLAQNQEIMDEYVAEVQEQDAIIKATEAELAKIAAAKQAELVKQNGGSSRSGTSTYIWPSDYYEITDYFGWREQPCEGASTYHQGIDIGASYGTPIYACASGRVTLAEYYGGYGNCVMIAHDSGYTTLYGHQSELKCYEGQWVEQGQVIGYVGSTGASTGPHIHLSFIDADGNFVDPLNFVG